MLYHRIKHIRRKAILFFLLILVLLVIFWRGRASSPEVPPAEPLQRVVTEEKRCAVTLSLTGIESEESIRLLMSVCRGTGIKPCVFVTAEWLEKHSEELPLLEGADLGLLFPKPPRKWTKKGTMAAMAEANEIFMTYTGAFPKFVRIAEGNGDQTVAVGLSSYGQLLVGSSAVIQESPAAGAIVDCGLLDSTTGYTLAQFYGASLSQGYIIQPLSELLAG